MPVDPVIEYLSVVETSFTRVDFGYIERYEEEILTSERANLRIRARFAKDYILEWNEAVIDERGVAQHLSYRYHFQDGRNQLIFRYDNTPHFRKLETFPNHKHLPDKVIAVNQPSASEVLDEVGEHLKGIPEYNREH